MKSISRKHQKKQRAFPAVHRRIRELDMTYGEVSEQMEMSPSTFSDKMSGRIPWRLQEVLDLLDIIALPEEPIDDFFPRRKVAS